MGSRERARSGGPSPSKIGGAIRVPRTLKTCRDCGAPHIYAHFQCHKCYLRDYYKKNSDFLRQQAETWYKENPERAKSARRKYYKENRAEILEKTCKYQHNHKNQHAASARKCHLKKHRGIDEVRYASQLHKQGGLCAICKASTPGGRYANWFIDHDHACCSGSRSCAKCFRGLLCVTCNWGLGSFKDDERVLAAAIKYMQEWRAKNAT